MRWRTGKWLWVLMVSAALTCAGGCSSGGGNSAGNGSTGDSAVLLAQSNVDSEGGTITAGDLEVTVPANAFMSAANISIYKYTDSAVMPDQRSGDVYGIEGLPESIGQPITVTIEAPGVESPTVFLRDDQGYSSSYGQNSLAFGLPLETRFAGGVVTATIPAAEQTTAAKARYAAQDGSASKFSLWVAGNTSVLESASGKYRIYYPAGAAGDAVAQETAAALDSAHYKLEGLGLSWANRTAWPVSVSVFSFSTDEADRFGQEEPSILGVNYHSLSFNYDKFKNASDFTDLKVTAGHELFHLMQFLYDPRNSYSQAKSQGAWLWMDEAVSTWFEHRMNLDPAFVPVTVTETNFNFILEPVETNTQGHGYGASMFLKYLVDQLGADTKIGDIVKMKADASALPADALLSAAGSGIDAHWRAFLDEYMAGTLYPSAVPSPDQTADLGKSGSTYYVFNTSTADGTTFTWDAPDLSAKVYMIGANYAWTEETAIELKLQDASNNGQAIIYRYKQEPAVWEKLGVIANGETYSHDGKALAANSERLVVLVSNGHAVSPYTGTTPISLSVNKKTVPVAASITINTPAGWTGVVKDFGAVEFTATLTGTSSKTVEWFDSFISYTGLWCGWPTSTNILTLWSVDANGAAIQWSPPQADTGCQAVYRLTARSYSDPTVTDSIDITIDYTP